MRRVFTRNFFRHNRGNQAMQTYNNVIVDMVAIEHRLLNEIHISNSLVVRFEGPSRQNMIQLFDQPTKVCASSMYAYSNCHDIRQVSRWQFQEGVMWCLKLWLDSMEITQTLQNLFICARHCLMTIRLEEQEILHGGQIEHVAGSCICCSSAPVIDDGKTFSTSKRIVIGKERRVCLPKSKAERCFPKKTKVFAKKPFRTRFAG